jgi:phosphohistidine phosphatase
MTGRRLILLRHAKSSWDDPSCDDFDRPLAERGRKAAPRMAAEMARRGLAPDLAIVSPALRTRQTWDLVAPALPRLPNVTFVPAIYEAEAETILDVVRGVPDWSETLLVIGHNPGLEALALDLASPDSDADALARLAEKFPTGALALFTVKADWSELAARSARLDAFIRPRDFT